ncbi:MAG: hypothetical protein ACTHPS_25435 [Streptosporangiaceae bacterium]
MRYRLMATYRGVPYEVGLGPSNFEVVLFAACPPPEELGFEPATGHWRKQVIRAEIDALWESRPVGTFRGEPCIVLDDPGDRLHIAYLGADPDRAASLGYWQVDRGVFELLAPRDEVTGLTEERVDKALHWGEQPDETGPMASYPYGRAPWPVAAPPVPAPQPAPEAAAPAQAASAANTALADAAPAGPPPTDARHDGAPQADTSRASASTDIPLASAPHADISRASTPPSGTPRASAEPTRTQSAGAPPADTQPASAPPADAQPASAALADVPRARTQQAGTLPARAPAAGLSRTSAAPTAAPAPPGEVPRASTQQASTQPTSAPPTEIPRPSAPPAEIPRASAPLDDTQRANTPLTGTVPVITPLVNAPAANAPLASAQLAGAPLASATLADVAPARAQRATGTLSAAPAEQTAPSEPTAPPERAIPVPGEAGAQPPADTWPPHVNAKADSYQDHMSGGDVSSLRDEPDPQPLPVPPGFYDPENAALADITPPGDVGGRAARRRRVSTREIFCELADLASIPRAAYALETEIEGAMCLLPTPDGFDVFIAADGMRHELRSFTDEEAAYFYLFGVLMAEAIRSGAQAPAVAATNPYGGTV